MSSAISQINQKPALTASPKPSKVVSLLHANSKLDDAKRQAETARKQAVSAVVKGDAKAKAKAEAAFTAAKAQVKAASEKQGTIKPAAKPTKLEAAKPAKPAPESGSGKKYHKLDDTLKIKLVAEKCPRRPGTYAEEQWNTMDKAKTVGGFRAEAGDMNYLKWFVKRGFAILN